AARGKRHRQFRQGGPAAPGAHRGQRLRSRPDAAVHRPVRAAGGARERGADRAERGQGSAALRDRRADSGRAVTSVTIAVPARRSVNPWIVALAVVIPTFMEVLDTTIANVALRYIAGGLSAPVTDSEWVITSYLAANAIILPISGWIATRLGRRNYFLVSIALFTIASMLCGMAT